MYLELGADLAKALGDFANQRGVDPEAAVMLILRERLLRSVQRLEPRDEWERQLLSVATDCGTSLTNEQVSSEGIHEDVPDELSQSAEAVRLALQDIANGDHGRDADEVLEKIRVRYGLP